MVPLRIIAGNYDDNHVDSDDAKDVAGDNETLLFRASFENGLSDAAFVYR